jgi:hypothetical protein
MNMNATVKTPKAHRSELLRFVHRPVLFRVDYPVPAPAVSSLLTALQTVFRNYDLSTDPYVVDLLAKQKQGYNVVTKLEQAFLKQNTYCYEQLKMLHSKSKKMAEELGTSVSEW